MRKCILITLWLIIKANHAVYSKDLKNLTPEPLALGSYVYHKLWYIEAVMMKKPSRSI